MILPVAGADGEFPTFRAYVTTSVVGLVLASSLTVIVQAPSFVPLIKTGLVTTGPLPALPLGP